MEHHLYNQQVFFVSARLLALGEISSLSCFIKLYSVQVGEPEASLGQDIYCPKRGLRFTDLEEMASSSRDRRRLQGQVNACTAYKRRMQGLVLPTPALYARLRDYLADWD